MMHNNPKPPKIGFAVFLIILGLFLLLDQAEVYDFGELIRIWWPLIFVYFGVLRIYTSQSLSDWFNWILIGGGALLILDRLDVLPMDLSGFIVPAAIILAGIWILIRSRAPITSLPSTDTSAAGNVLQEQVFMSGTKKYYTSTFSRGSVSVIMGGIEIDLREAEPTPGATLDLQVLMGGCEIYLPANWTIEYRTQTFLGGIEDSRKNRPENDTRHLVIVTGTVIMGGIEIKN